LLPTDTQSNSLLLSSRIPTQFEILKLLLEQFRVLSSLHTHLRATVAILVSLTLSGIVSLVSGLHFACAECHKKQQRTNNLFAVHGIDQLRRRWWIQLLRGPTKYPRPLDHFNTLSNPYCYHPLLSIHQCFFQL